MHDNGERAREREEADTLVKRLRSSGKEGKGVQKERKGVKKEGREGGQ